MNALTPRELDVLDALRADRDACGPGVTRADVSVIGETRWPGSVIARLVGHGYTVGVTGDWTYQLGHGEPVPARAPDVGRPAVSSPSGQASGVPAGPESLSLFEIPKAIAA